MAEIISAKEELIEAINVLTEDECESFLNAIHRALAAISDPRLDLIRKDKDDGE